ncbi:MAG: HicB family protein [Parcubacteria group bacterium CG2_30_36_21]|nr:MAG: HicB family protein [Parcubacteria group bacterium CG2_30_36_21]
MKEISYVVWKEDKYFISKCLNVEVSSFRETIEEAISNLKEAVELFFENETFEFPEIQSIILGKDKVYA